MKFVHLNEIACNDRIDDAVTRCVSTGGDLEPKPCECARVFLSTPVQSMISYNYSLVEYRLNHSRIIVSHMSA